MLALASWALHPQRGGLDRHHRCDRRADQHLRGCQACAPHLLAPIAVAAYTYMSLVPIIQPPIMRLLTTQEERAFTCPMSSGRSAELARILFPIVVTVITGVIAPQASPLIGTLMFGNLMRESGVVERLVRSAGNEIANIATIFLGLTIGATMVGASFANLQTLIILVLGVLAFVLDTAAGVLFGKLLNVVTHGHFNPLIGAAGISAFPMAARCGPARLARKRTITTSCSCMRWAPTPPARSPR